jgi:RTX calcium-binding nonapeptide repeat (4 copies)
VSRGPASIWLLGVATALAALSVPSSAFADARLSRAGNVVTLTSDGRADVIRDAGTDSRELISYYVERGRVLRAGPGCRRRRGPRITRVIVTCGAPSRTQVNRVTLRVRLGGGDDTFVAAPWDDVQPRIVADGGAGNDTIYGSTNSDDIDGGAGDDKLYGLDEADDIDGGDGADLVVGGAGDDGLGGGAGSDRVYGDELGPTTAWGNDLLTVVDFGPDALTCGEGVDAAVVDAGDVADASCENLAGGQVTPPRDVVGTLPLAVAIGAPAATPGGLARILRGQPIRMPVTFSAAAHVVAKLEVSAAEGRALGLPSRERVIADSLGTPLALTPQTINTQIRLRWPVRRYLTDEDRVRATLTITAQDVNLAPTVATREITLRR